MAISTNEEFNINDKAYNAAKYICSKLSDAEDRKRAFKALLCLDVLADYLYSNNFKVDISKNLYKIPKINEEFEFTDLYCNGRFIDVLPVIKGQYILIPKIHFEYNVVPDLYVVADYNPSSKKVKLIG